MTVLGREAVVIIHGIGEQAPLSTVRGFVGRRTATSRGEEARGGVADAGDAVFTEPSPVGARTDDLTYVVAWNQSGTAADILAARPGWRKHERAAVTEFHEFYWAPRYRATTLGHLTGWLVPLLLRPLRTFTTPRLRGPHGAVRLLPLLPLAAALVVVGAYRADVVPGWVAGVVLAVGVLAALLLGTLLGLVAAAKVVVLAVVTLAAAASIAWGLAGVARTVAAVGASAGAVVVGGFLAARITRTLGDAARYLAGTHPGNVEENETIRRAVVDLLTRLHDVTDPDTGRNRYDRIVVVGHSLGSVIAYDAVRLLWAQRSRQLVLPGSDGTAAADAVRAVEVAGEVLRAAAKPGSGADLAAARQEYLRAQRGAQLVMRDLDAAGGSRRWIVTDLVTLGSPLTYADAFLATDPEDLAERFDERSLAAVPPVVQTVRRSAGHPYRLWVPRAGRGAEEGTTRWHHAAPFACVTWTNLWFEHDVVGGAVGPHFGPGVRDVSLGGSRWLAAMAFAYPHSSYWTTSSRSLVRAGSEQSRRVLREILRRRPTLLLTARSTPDDATVRALRDLLVGGEGGAPGGGAEAGPLDVAVRLYVGGTDAERRGAYLPVATAPLPEASARRRLRALLGEDSRVALLVSVDLLGVAARPLSAGTSSGAAGGDPSPDELREPDEREPGADGPDDEAPDMPDGSEELEAVGEPEELETVGEGE